MSKLLNKIASQDQLHPKDLKRNQLISPSYMPGLGSSRRKSGSNAMINADLAELYQKPAPQQQSTHSKYQSNNQLSTKVKSSAKYSTDTHGAKPPAQ